MSVRYLAGVVLVALTLAAAFAQPGAPALAQGAPAVDRAKLAQNAGRRFPQPVRVSDLADIPLLDGKLGRLGTAEKVVRDADGGVSLVVRYGGMLGFGARPIALPIEGLAMLGRQVVAMDFSEEQLDAWPTWSGAPDQALPGTDSVRVGLTKN